MRAAVDADAGVGGQRGACFCNHTGRPPLIVVGKGGGKGGFGGRRLAPSPPRCELLHVHQRLKRGTDMAGEADARLMHVMGIFDGLKIHDALLGDVPDVAPAGAHFDGVVAQEKDNVGLLDQRQ